MGCGGSKEDVATGNTTASAGGSKLLRRKSAVSTSHAATSSSDNSSGVAVNDVAKAKADDGEVTSTAIKDVIEEKKEEDVAKKHVANDGAAPAPPVVDAKVTEVAPVPDEGDQAKKQAEEEEQLPESTMADEAAAVEGPRPKLDEAKEVARNDGEEKMEDARESKTINKEEERATSPTPAPAPTNEDGKLAGQQNITEPAGVEAKPAIDEEKVAVSESSAGKKKTNTDDDEQTAAAAPSEPPAN